MKNYNVNVLNFVLELNSKNKVLFEELINFFCKTEKDKNFCAFEKFYGYGHDFYANIFEKFKIDNINNVNDFCIFYLTWIFSHTEIVHQDGPEGGYFNETSYHYGRGFCHHNFIDFIMKEIDYEAARLLIQNRAIFAKIQPNHATGVANAECSSEELYYYFKYHFDRIIKMITETKISREEVKTLFVNWGDPEEIKNEKGATYTKITPEAQKLRDKTLTFVDKLYDLQEEIEE